MLSTTAARPAVSPRQPRRPTASLVDGALDITVYDVLELHELFDHARSLLRPIIESRRIDAIQMVVRARDTSRGGSAAVEVEMQVRTAGHPISIRCVRSDAMAAIELAAIVLRLRLSSSDRPEAAAQ